MNYEEQLKALKAQTQAQANYYGQSGPSQGFVIANQVPSEPTMLAQATGLLNHVAMLEMHTASLRGVLFGEGESDLSKLPVTPASCLLAMLADTCQRVASLCGELATIKNKLGCDPMPKGIGCEHR